MNDDTLATPQGGAQQEKRATGPLRRGGTARKVALFHGLLVLLLVGAELSLRWVVEPSDGFAAYLFHTQLKIARWEFLANTKDPHTGEGIAPQPKNADDVEMREQDRPPFDRIDVSFRVVTNEFGLRDEPFPKTKEPGALHVMLLGDSSTFGAGVELPDRYDSILESVLGSSVRIFNLAVSGATSNGMRDQFELYSWLDPDIVIIHAAANDLDKTMFRLAQKGNISGLGIQAQWIVGKSRLLQRFVYGLFGDPYMDQMNETAEDAARFYAPALTSLFRQCGERDIPVVVVSSCFPDGFRYGQHVVEQCRLHPGICLGSVEIDMENPGRWLPDWPQRLEAMRGLENWLERTAVFMDIDQSVLEKIFPYHRLFLDIVHANKDGHALIAVQIERFLREKTSLPWRLL